MKTSTIRKLAAIYGTTMFVPHPTVPIACSLLDPLSTEESSGYREPKKRFKKRRFLRMYSPKGNSSSKKNTSKIEISKEYNKDISLRNLNIIKTRFQHRIAYWQLYLLLKEKALNDLWMLLQENPNDKALLAQFKKLEHSYNDSLNDFYAFHDTYSSLKNNVPIGAIPYGFKNSKNSSKLIQNDTFKHYKKKRKQHINHARKNKQLEKNFWFRQWEESEDYEFSKKSYEEAPFMSNNVLVEDFKKAHVDLIDALLALNSPCVEDAAWAIHDGTENQFSDSIKKAREIFIQYEKALDRYELLEAYMQCPEEY